MKYEYKEIYEGDAGPTLIDQINELGKEEAEKMLTEQCLAKGYVPMKPFNHTPVELSVHDWRVSVICGYAGKKSAREIGVVEKPQNLSVQWDDVYVCDKCKTKQNVREHGQFPPNYSHLGGYESQNNITS